MRKNETPTNLVNFPHGFLCGLFYHSIDKESITHEFHQREDQDSIFRNILGERSEQLAERYRNDFTLGEIEVLIALFFLSEELESFTLKSEYHLIRIASGFKKKSERKFYRKCLESLRKKRTFLVIENGTKFCHTKVISTKQTKNGIKITFSKAIRKKKGSWRKIPLAPSEIFKSGGLKRIHVSHLLLLFYLIERIQNHSRTSKLDKLKLFKNMGLSHYFQSCHGNRARKQLFNGLEALKKANVLLSWIDSDETQILIEPNLSFFGKTPKDKPPLKKFRKKNKVRIL